MQTSLWSASYVRSKRVTARMCCRGARRAVISRPHTAAAGEWDGETDGRTPYRYNDPAAPTLRAVQTVCCYRRLNPTCSCDESPGWHFSNARPSPALHFSPTPLMYLVYYPRDDAGTSYSPVSASVSVCMSVCHKSVFCRSGWTNRAGIWHGSFRPSILHYTNRKFGYLHKYFT